MVNEESIAESYPLGQKLWWLIIGRLGAALVLLLAGTLWVRGSARQESWSKTLPLLSVVVGLTILYSLAHRFSNQFELEARIQFMVDVLLTTWLVWTTGVINSPYTALYIVIISASSLFLGPRDVVVTSVGCAFAFTSCALTVITGFRELPAGEIPQALSYQTVQSVGLSDI